MSHVKFLEFLASLICTVVTDAKLPELQQIPFTLRFGKQTEPNISSAGLLWDRRVSYCTHSPSKRTPPPPIPQKSIQPFLLVTGYATMRFNQK